VIYELFAVVTNSKRVEKPLSIKEATDLCLDLLECNEIEKIDPSNFAPLEVFKLAQSLNLSIRYYSHLSSIRPLEVFKLAHLLTCAEQRFLIAV